MNNQNNQEKITLIIDKLEQSFSQPESNDFIYFIKNNNISSATKMLKDILNSQDSKLIINHFKNEFNKQFILTDTKKDYSHLNENDNILVSYGGKIFKTKVILSQKTDITFKAFVEPDSYRSLPLDKASQIWSIDSLT